MYEVHQKTDDPLKAVRQGIIKTGPIISAAALMVFVVVVAFAFSGVYPLCCGYAGICTPPAYDK
jgi:uncharacterized membrane protein YdfJ with MMPL/SSD domain